MAQSNSEQFHLRAAWKYERDRACARKKKPCGLRATAYDKISTGLKICEFHVHLTLLCIFTLCIECNCFKIVMYH